MANAVEKIQSEHRDYARVLSCLLATMDKIIDARGKQINIFWSRISAYSNPITKANRDEMVRVLKRLPPVLAVYICGNLYNFAIASFKDKAFKDKKADVMKKNRKMIITIFEDPSLAKDVLGKMR